MRPSRTCSASVVAVAASLAGPAAPLAADTLFVSSFDFGQITRIDLATGAQTIVVAGLSSPEDGACSPGGEIFFAESLGGRITRWSQDGSGATNIVPAAGAADGPEGLSFDRDGNLYFNTRQIGVGADGAFRIDGADPANGLVQVVPPFTSWGEGSDVVLAGPHAGALLVVARPERRVHISEPPGAPAAVFIDSPAFPPDGILFGVASDGCGDVYVAVTQQFGAGAEVYRFDPEGTFLEVYATGMSRATFLEFDSAGNLYVADSSANSIWKVAPDHTRTLLANIAGQPTGLAMCRDQAVPTCIFCDAGGPYATECAGGTTCLGVDASASSEIHGRPLAYGWSSDCPGGSFADPTQAATELCVDTSSAPCPLSCQVTVAVSNGFVSASCSADVTIADTIAPEATCLLMPVPPQPPGSPASPASPAPPASPSSASSARVEVVCAGSDGCDPAPRVEASVRLERHEVQDGRCVLVTEEVPVDCGEILDLVRLAPPCPARPPRSPRSPASARSDGPRILAGETIALEVRATDACGNASPTCIAPAPLLPPPPPRCPVSACGVP